jgi:hypothetical protein
MGDHTQALKLPMELPHDASDLSPQVNLEIDVITLGITSSAGFLSCIQIWPSPDHGSISWTHQKLESQGESCFESKAECILNKWQSSG